MARTKTILESAVAGAVSAVLAYSLLISPATLAALAIHRPRRMLHSQA